MPNREIIFTSANVKHVCGVSYKRKKKLAGGERNHVHAQCATQVGVTTTWRANLNAPGGGADEKDLIRWIAFDAEGKIIAVATRRY